MENIFFQTFQKIYTNFRRFRKNYDPELFENTMDVTDDEIKYFNEMQDKIIGKRIFHSTHLI